MVVERWHFSGRCRSWLSTVSGRMRFQGSMFIWRQFCKWHKSKKRNALVGLLFGIPIIAKNTKLSSYTFEMRYYACDLGAKKTAARKNLYLPLRHFLNPEFFLSIRLTCPVYSVMCLGYEFRVLLLERIPPKVIYQAAVLSHKSGETPIHNFAKSNIVKRMKQDRLEYKLAMSILCLCWYPFQGS